MNRFLLVLPVLLTMMAVVAGIVSGLMVASAGFALADPAGDLLGGLPTETLPTSGFPMSGLPVSGLPTGW